MDYFRNESMEFKTQYNIGDKLYYWSIDKVKILYGEITGISFYATLNGDNIGIKLDYYIRPSGNALSERVPEHLMFKDRDDVFDFCYKLTNDL